MEDIVSVIIPVYNTEKYIDRCLESVLNQTYSNIEIILIDDGSKDNSGKLCDSYASIDNRIKVIHKKNQGLGMARNTGIDNCTGKYLMFIDSDDYIELDMIEKLYKSIKKENSDICYCDFNRVQDGKVISEGHLEHLAGLYKGEKINEIIIPNIIGGAPSDKNDDIIGWSVCKCLFDTKIARKVKFHSEREMISEDIIFQLDYLHNVNRVSVIPNALYNYCINGNSLSRTYREDRFEKIKKLYNEQIKRLESLSCLSLAKIRADRMLISNIRMELMIDVVALEKEKSIDIIRGIIDDELVKKVISEYPINKLPLKQRIFAFLIKHKKYKSIFFLVKSYTNFRYKDSD